MTGTVVPSWAVILRGIFLKGLALAVLWPQRAALGALGVATLWLTTRRFHKTLP